MKKCEDIQFLLTLYALDNLGGVSKQEVSQHLKECKKCQKEFEEIKQGLNIINDVLEETAEEDLKLSDERHSAILRASKIKIKKTNWITTHKPALGIAASTLVVFGITWAIISSMQAPKYASNEVSSLTCTIEEKEEQVDSLKRANAVPIDKDFQDIDVEFDSSIAMQNPNNIRLEEGRSQIKLKKVASPVEFKGIYDSNYLVAKGATMKPAKVKAYEEMRGETNNAALNFTEEQMQQIDVKLADKNDAFEPVDNKIVNHQGATLAVTKELQITLPTHSKHMQVERDPETNPENQLNVESKVQKLNIGGYLLKITALLMLTACIFAISFVFRKK